MGLFSFIKSAGEKVFGGTESTEQKAQKIKDHVSKYGFDLSQITFAADGDKIKISGMAKNLDEKQKILAAAGNVEGISGIEDDLKLSTPIKIEIPDISKTMHTVTSGDNLSKIAQQYYGDSNKYNVIFEANKPMLSHPDKIYDGQVLYIPPVGEMEKFQGAAQTESAEAPQTYTVQSNDTLSVIAKKVYGDPNKYMTIFEANRDKLKDPNSVNVGQVLNIPPKN